MNLHIGYSSFDERHYTNRSGWLRAAVLGANDITQAKPMQAVLASLGAFVLGGILPFLVSIFAPIHYMVVSQYVFAIVFLVLLGTIAAKTGGSGVWKSVVRVCFWGTAAMGVTALIGYIFGTSVGLG